MFRNVPEGAPVLTAAAMRAAAEAVAAPHPFAGFWLEAPLGLLRARVAGRGADASDATVEVLERAAAADPGPVAWRRLDAAGDALGAARAALGLASAPLALKDEAGA